MRAGDVPSATPAPALERDTSPTEDDATAAGRLLYGVSAVPADQTAASRIRLDLSRPDAIRQTVGALFGVPINERHITNRRALGLYKVAPQAIRVRNRNNIDVIAHEVGHHLSETHRAVRELMRAHQTELLAITPKAYLEPAVPLRIRREEGFAEFVRLYPTQPERAVRQASSESRARRLTPATNACGPSSPPRRPLVRSRGS